MRGYCRTPQRTGRMLHHFTKCPRRRPLLFGVLGLLVLLLPDGPAFGQSAEPTDTPSRTQRRYAAIYLDSVHVGYSGTIVTRSENRVTTRQVLDVTVNIAESPFRIQDEVIFVETAAGRPLRFQTVKNRGGIAQQVRGEISDDGKLQLEIQLGEATLRRTVPYPDGALMPHGLNLLRSDQPVEPGKSFQAKVFDETTYGALDATYAIGARSVHDILGRFMPLHEVTMTYQSATGEIAHRGFVDEEFQTRKMILPLMNLEMIGLDCHELFATAPVASQEEFFRAMSLKCPNALDLRGTRTVTFEYQPIGENPPLVLPDSPNLTVRKVGSGGKWEVRVSTPPILPGATRPYEGDDEDLLSLLKPTETLPADDNEIHVLLRDAIGRETDAVKAARGIESFVQDYLDDADLTVGFGSVKDVLVSRKGDATEHALLAATICRAAGLPAEVCFGYLYQLRRGEERNILIPHAWVRVRIDEHWLWLDPYLGSADVGRILVAVGDGREDTFFGVMQAVQTIEITHARVSM